MDGLLDELDGQDEEELMDINIARAPGIGGTGLADDNVEMAFNKEDQMNLKYNVSTNNAAGTDSKKRNYDEFKASGVASQRKNPFMKEVNPEPVEQAESVVNSSAYESAIDKQIVEKPAATEQEEQIDAATKQAQE